MDIVKYKDRFNLRDLVTDLYRLTWSGFFRLIFGRNWHIKHQNYATLDWIRHLFDKPFRYYYVRRVGCLVQAKTPSGILLQPLERISIKRAKWYLQKIIIGRSLRMPLPKFR